MVLGGVLWFGWRAAEVLLLFWVETALMVLLLPARTVARAGAAGLGAGLANAASLGIFVAFHAFFLCGLLYGVDWDQVEGGPGGWSAPAKGAPPDWFAAAARDLPWIGALGIVGFAVAALVRDWQKLKSAGGDAGDMEADPVAAMTSGHVVVMHVAIILGGSAILVADGDWGLLVVLIVLKTGYEAVQTIRRTWIRKGAAAPGSTAQ